MAKTERSHTHTTLHTLGISLIPTATVFLSFLFTFCISAQSWKDYAEEIIQESASEKRQESKLSIPEPSFTVSDETDESDPEKSDFDSDDSVQTGIISEYPTGNRPKPESADPSLISDASLFGLCLSAPGKLWAVGDRGSVWMSSDNGEKWFLVRVPTTANLKAVSFADSNNGLIVGGKVIPGTNNGHGIILRTQDGGQHWSLIDTNGLPFLYDVCYSEDGTAQAWGDSSELYPSGYFFSEDGGQTWDAPFKTIRHPGWKKGNTGITPFSGLCRNGKNYLIDAPDCKEIDSFLGSIRLTDFAVSESAIYFAAGQNGLFFWDGTNSPRQVPLPPESKHFDFNAVSFNGRRIDLAGDPGTKIFSSIDGGRTWSTHETGITVPIRKILFADQQNGFAIGDLGNILVTYDGGETWVVKHEGGRRAAWLGLFDSPELIPYHWIVSMALKDGFIGVGDLLTPVHESSEAELFDEVRIRESFLTAGGSSFFCEDKFAVPSPELNLPIEESTTSWRRQSYETAEISLRRHIVQMIRTWRPTLLVLSEKNSPPVFLTPTIRSLASIDSDVQDKIRQTAENSTGHVDPIRLALMVEQHLNTSSETLPLSELESPISQMIRKAILDSVTAAADPQQFPEQIEELRLPPWKVERVGIISDRTASLTLRTEDYISSLGQTVDETALLAQKIASSQKICSPYRGFEFVPVEGGEPPVITRQTTSPFAGLEISRSSEIRRPMTANPIEENDALPFIRQRRRLLALADHLTDSSAGRNEIIHGNIDSVLENADSETASEFLLRLGQNLVRAGDPDSAAEYWERLLSQYPESNHAREGAVRLLRIYAGLERIRRVAVGRVAVNRTWTPEQKAETDESERPLPKIVDHANDAVRVGAIIRDYFPELYMSPEVRFPLAAAQCRGGELNNAMGYYYHRSLLSSKDFFIAKHAAAEYALINGKREKNDIPLSIGSCYPAARIPFLDGILENDIWDEAETFQLTGNADFPKTFISFLNGDEHLFIGIEAHQSDSNVPKATGERVRDIDLSDFDHVEIAIDPDRDFINSYYLEFDCRGCVCDACQDDKNWNPKIYIARKVTDFGWILEIAIPWRELCDASPPAGNVWGIALRRVIPGHGSSAWNEEGKINLKDGFGYLQFY